LLRVNSTSPNPRIDRLLALQDALVRLASTLALAVPKQRPLAQAAGAVLASDLHATADLPSQAIAFADGWAVNADDLIGSSAYSAALLTPPPKWVNAGDPMPNADAVLSPEGVIFVSPDVAEAAGSIVSGEGVRLPGQDIGAGECVLGAGTRLEPRHIGILRACGLETVTVRVPQLRIVIASDAAAAHAEMIRRWLETAGAKVIDILAAPGDRSVLAMNYGRTGADLVVSLGGTGRGRNDCAVAALSDAGAVAVHGVALHPGESVAFGNVSSVPVLLLPGRVDALIAGMLALAVPALAGLSGLRSEERPSVHRLMEKVNSTVGLSELFLGLPAGDLVRASPLAEARLDALAQSIGWFLVPAESEGFGAGHTVHLRPFHPRLGL
jgi:molybdopterin biosynthesis enzyme